MVSSPHDSVPTFGAGSLGSEPGPARSALAADGVVCLKGAFERPWLSLLERGIDEALSGASQDVDIVQRAGDEGRFSFSSGAWRTVEPFRRFIMESPIADLVWPLIGSAELVLFYDFLLIKEARSAGASTPWHQDHSYYPLDGTKVVNSWVALDEIPLESTLRFLRGSHQPPLLYRAVDFDDPMRDYRHARTELPLPPTVDAEADVIATPLDPGDMLVWWSHTLHCAPGNRLHRRRAAFSVNWLGDGVTYNGRAALDTYVDSSVAVGEPMTGEKFPLIRPS